VPFVFVLLAIALAQATIAVDSALEDAGVTLPAVLRTTITAGHSLLTTIATATITVAGVAFSISLLVVQLASTQYSPRVLHSFYRDRFTKISLGFVVGTFSYSLLVLRTVHRGVGGQQEAVIPNVSILTALVLGIIAILTIVAFIDHSAHSISVSQIVQLITEETREQIARLHPERRDDAPEPPPAPAPPDDALEVAADRDGWLQQIDGRRLLEALPPGGVALIDAHPGKFVAEGIALCRVWPAPTDEAERARLEKRVGAAVHLGRRRTMQQDVEFGLRQLADIALRALSPGVNDPTTANEAISHATAILRELMARDLPPRSEEDEEGRRLVRLDARTFRDYADVAFDQVRRAAADHPAVIVHLLRSLGPIVRYLEDAGLFDRAAILREKATEAIRQVEAADHLDEDLAGVLDVARHEGLSPPARRRSRRAT
jgi:uncharacterized membrane protein